MTSALFSYFIKLFFNRLRMLKIGVFSLKTDKNDYFYLIFRCFFVKIYKNHVKKGQKRVQIWSIFGPPKICLKIQWAGRFFVRKRAKNHQSWPLKITSHKIYLWNWHKFFKKGRFSTLFTVNYLIQPPRLSHIFDIIKLKIHRTALKISIFCYKIEKSVKFRHFL